MDGGALPRILCRFNVTPLVHDDGAGGVGVDVHQNVFGVGLVERSFKGKRGAVFAADVAEPVTHVRHGLHVSRLLTSRAGGVLDERPHVISKLF